jgi:hypothetical protein
MKLYLKFISCSSRVCALSHVSFSVSLMSTSNNNKYPPADESSSPPSPHVAPPPSPPPPPPPPKGFIHIGRINFVAQGQPGEPAKFCVVFI